ncbi:MAG: hypothetical protein RMM98_08270 [Acidobacteriota bacterium]|nr:hypothetical protein [Blastocatellia bacterium]MDW8239596.1 hypothetical protein [Acidobacteriota bacterium]
MRPLHSNCLIMMMKRTIGLIVLLLIGSASARAAVLCARSLCPTQAMLCCCTLLKPTPSPKMQALWRGACQPEHTPSRVGSKQATCCIVSPASPKLPGDVPPLLSARCIHTADQVPLLARVTQQPDFSPRGLLPIFNAGVASADGTQTYLRLAILRI